MSPSDNTADREDTVTVEMLPVVLRADSATRFDLQLDGLWDGPVRQEPVRSRIAPELADLESIGLDLRRVIDLCRRLDDDDLDDLVRSAVWESAVMAYGRCFNSGRASLSKTQRRKYPPDLTRDLPNALADAHEQAIRDRNQHVGHRVNDGEHVVVSAVRQVQDGPVVGLAVGSVRLMHPQDHGSLRDIARELHRRLLPVLERERESLLQYLEQRSDA